MHRIPAFLVLLLVLAWPHAAAARFLSADPVAPDTQTGANFHRYAYANNSPYRYIDPDGRWAEDAVLGIPSLVLGTKSLYDNVRAGDVPAAILDGIGIAYDIGAIATPGVPGGAGFGIRAGRTAAAEAASRIADDALVVRGGSATGANSAAGLAKGSGVHPSGVAGFSVESASGMSVCQLCANMPVRYNQVGVTTAGQVRLAGGDVVQTSGRSTTHATVTGLTPEAASHLLTPTRPNPLPKEKPP